MYRVSLYMACTSHLTSQLFMEAEVIDFRLFFLWKIGVQCYSFSSKHGLRCIPQVIMSYFIFMQFKIFSYFSALAGVAQWIEHQPAN